MTETGYSQKKVYRFREYKLSLLVINNQTSAYFNAGVSPISLNDVKSNGETIKYVWYFRES